MRYIVQCHIVIRSGGKGEGREIEGVDVKISFGQQEESS